MTSDHKFQPHHAAISAHDLDETEAFYSIFGLRPALYWAATDGSLKIAHLLHPSGYILEIFCYTQNEARGPLSLEAGNDLEVPGVKHIAFQVHSVREIYQELSRQVDPDAITEIRQGRTDIQYFFVCDPNGIWIEVVQDDRSLDPESPLHLG